MLFKAISFFFSPIWNIFDPYLNSIADLFSAKKAQRVTIKSVFIFIVVTTLIGFAFLSYITFYYVYIPKIAHSKPVHLQYYHDRSIHSKIDFTENGLYSRFLTADQTYDISIDLEVPESNHNIDLGNFMIYLELKSKNNETVQSSSRPCILTYKSNLFRITSTIWKIVPLILGFVKEDQKLKVVMFENFIEDGGKPVTHAYLTIPDKDPEVYNTKILLDAHFKGLRYLMYYHYFSTAMIFISLFIFWEIFFSIFSWKIIVSQWQTLSPPKTIKYINKGDGGDGNDDDNDDDRHERQETDNVKWLGNKLDDKTTKTLGNDGEDGDESESASNNDELSDNDSVISRPGSINQTNTDYDESGYETTGEGNNYNTTTDNSNNNTDVETSRRKLSRLSSNNGDEDNNDD